MKKNIFDEAAKQEILNRSLQLTEESAPLWGTMNAAEMLRHCSEALKATLIQQDSYKPTTIKQKIARFAMLNFIKAFPKGAKTTKQLDVKKNNITGLLLPVERESYNSMVQTFVDFKGDFKTHHPYFGNLTRNKWGTFTWMHLDHHLRQFGV